ncbi:lachrymatory-factor synthase-like [Phragmites australis]|uniref:lachrymatory-factor synthase-like n=1 Tax=Phragmites australis TaxID=29695 RepID=UPI002D7A15A9|nr:lachrymatory-factor synthase-like [Phragmites australis]
MAKEAAAEQQEQGQWQGAVEARLPSTPASAAWPHIASFCALHRYLPGIDLCERAAGADGQPGCVRYCASFAPGTEEVARWAREELLELDDATRRLDYAVVGSSIGFGRYVASITVVPEEEEGEGCRLVWAFECEPVQGWSRDGLVGYLDGAIKGMAARIAAAAADRAGGDVAA